MLDTLDSGWDCLVTTLGRVLVGAETLPCLRLTEGRDFGEMRAFLIKLVSQREMVLKAEGGRCVRRDCEQTRRVEIVNNFLKSVGSIIGDPA